MNGYLKLTKQLKKDYIDLISDYDSRFIISFLDKKVCKLSEEIEDIEYEIKHRKN